MSFCASKCSERKMAAIVEFKGDTGKMIVTRSEPRKRNESWFERNRAAKQS
jgi:hypothetical protein